LEPYFSSNISFKRSKNGGGKIVIDFSSDEEIDSIIERLRNK
jgi:ParB family chromosome partitioning protein